MREKKKITLILLSMVACVCIAFGLMQKQDVVQADGLSQIKYEKTYELGETLDVQAATITQGGQEYAAKAVVRYPSGVKYEKEKIVLSEAGVYTVEYTANANGKLISKELVDAMLQKQSGDGSDSEEGYYGYGMWIIDNPKGTDYAYFQGCDPGVSFLSEYNADKKILSVLVSNFGDNVWKEMRKIRECLYK